MKRITHRAPRAQRPEYDAHSSVVWEVRDAQCLTQKRHVPVLNAHNERSVVRGDTNSVWTLCKAEGQRGQKLGGVGCVSGGRGNLHKRLLVGIFRPSASSQNGIRSTGSDTLKPRILLKLVQETNCVVHPP